MAMKSKLRFDTREPVALFQMRIADHWIKLNRNRPHSSASLHAADETARDQQAVSRPSDTLGNSSSRSSRNECAESLRHNADTLLCSGRGLPFPCEMRSPFPETCPLLRCAIAQP